MSTVVNSHSRLALPVSQSKRSKPNKFNTSDKSGATSTCEPVSASLGILAEQDSRAGQSEDSQSETITKSSNRVETAHHIPGVISVCVPANLEPKNSTVLKEAAFDELLEVLQVPNPQASMLMSFKDLVYKL